MNTMRTASLLRGLAPLLLLLAGCVAYDGREELVLMPQGELHAQEFIRVSLHEDGRLVDGRLLVDGHEAKRTDQGLDVRGLEEGEHWLVGVRDEGPRPATTDPRRLHVDRTPPTIRFDPPEGTLAGTGRFRVNLRTNEPFPEALRVPPALQTTPTATVTFAPDGRSAVVDFGQPLAELGSAAVRFEGMDAAGNRGSASAYWTAAGSEYAFSSPQGTTVASEAVDVQLAWLGATPPPSVELLAGGAVIGTLQPPAWTFRWDVTGVAPGEYPLSVRAAGWATRQVGTAVVIVDRRPPALLSCAQPSRGLAGTSVRECIELWYDEPLRAITPSITIGGVPVGLDSYWADPWRPGRAVVCPGFSIALPLPSTVTLAVRAEDEGGAASEDVCHLEAPAWRAPLSALPESASPIDALSIAARWTPVGFPDAEVTLTGLGSPGAELDGGIGAWELSADASWSAPWELHPTLPIVAFAGGKARDVAWGEADPVTGTSRVYTGARYVGEAWRSPYLIDGDAGADLEDLALGSAVIAWSRAAAGGGRAVCVNTVGETTELPRRSPEAIARQPAVAGAHLVWIEQSPGEPALLRSAARDAAGAWILAPGSLNADAAVSAGSPEVAALGDAGAALLVWEEGGRIQSRYRGHEDDAWGAALALSPEGTPARQPRVAGGPEWLVIFLVEDAAGERIELRLRDLGASGVWRAGPSPGGVVGARARSLAVGSSTPRPIAWIDGDGLPHVRVRNE